MPAFGFALPGQVLFGRGEAAKAPGLTLQFGRRGLVVHGASPARAVWLVDALRDAGAQITTLSCGAEPTLPMLLDALTQAREARPDWVLAIGGGAVIDMGKALAALIPATSDPMDHLEVVGRGLPLLVDPLPFIAMSTTAGTGAEATRNAVIGLPDHGRKVSLRDARMLPRIAIVDPALTDHCPHAVTLASGLDALAQVIEPYVSAKATPFTDAISGPAIAPGLKALQKLMQGEDAAARDVMAWVSLSGGVALANGGLGAVHGFAGVIGGETGAAHGAICGVLLGPVLDANRACATGEAARRIADICDLLATAFGVDAGDAPAALADWARDAGLPSLSAQGLTAARHADVAVAATQSSSYKGNPAPLDTDDLLRILARAG
ncbi:iron-containing alcohol dehydrogenase [Paracoccus aurantiacus]|uniref:Iron-containing alcohol dehydrogenase n=1 Tax=Paracoccus aurantiacus TaxID=2599412 RepID=A0A5C6S6U8_9RHOB|nr:iron-containing alcohol dehydrogenase [Paracoccus aurantiacus]TXB70083.1 iron-containing alcohol dehydrogenase [Paracoccus aurantiacus]